MHIDPPAGGLSARPSRVRAARDAPGPGDAGLPRPAGVPAVSQDEIAAKGGQLADLELRHRRRARCEKDPQLEGHRPEQRPLKDFAQNQVWIAVVQLATELTAWMQMLAFAGTPAQSWEPKKLRHRLFSIAARIGRKARRTWLRLSAHAPYRDLLLGGLGRLRELPQPT